VAAACDITENFVMPTVNDQATLSIAWMEHQILEHIKQALRVTLDWQAPEVSMPRKLSSLQFTAKSFQRHLERLMRIEEEGGYMREVLDVLPNLQNRIERLAEDHGHFRSRIRELIPQLNGLHDWDEARFEQVTGELRSMLDDVDRHDAQEVELIEESLWLDVGGEG
jgi:hemerythrin-like domain-containing protein